FRTEAARLRAAEAGAARRATRCLAAGPEAAEIVKRFAPEVQMAVVPNGLDVDTLPGPVWRSNWRSKNPTVVLNTMLEREMELRDAIEFHDTVMPLVRERVPNARLSILSREPSVTPLVLAGADITAGVADTGPLLQQATVAVAPLRHGREVQRSVLEPMAVGLAVVATSVARQRLERAGGEELSIADEPKDFARKIADLLSDEGARAELGSRGQCFVAEHHSWSRMASQFVRLVEAVKHPSAPHSRPAEPLAQAQL
ncbi:MAG TPA: glycosyltransferase family 4 protein, partial [Myxococcaceae bacterium]|nr:glycosyltransferase family 4 protein [Myxococcaceae bacterium]